MPPIRSEPLSIESLLQKQKEEKDAASKVSLLTTLLYILADEFSKPKFLSKEERARIAIAKRAQEIKEQRERDEQTKQDREALERDADELRRKEESSGASNRYGSGGRC